MRTYRAARLITERAKHVAEQEIERDLEEVDASTAGTSAEELTKLRASNPDAASREK